MDPVLSALKIELLGTLGGTQVASSGDLRATGDRATFELCRMLVREGRDMESPMEVLRDGRVAYRIRSLGTAAEMTVKDDSRGTPKVIAGRPRSAMPQPPERAERVDL